MAVRFFTERVRFPGSARADDTVRIVEGDQVRAVHTRSYAQGATIEDPAPIEALAQGQGAEASLPATPAAPKAFAVWSPGDLANALRLDADQDGLPDGWEVFRGLNPRDPADGLADVDRDGAHHRLRGHPLPETRQEGIAARQGGAVHRAADQFVGLAGIRRAAADADRRGHPQLLIADRQRGGDSGQQHVGKLAEAFAGMLAGQRQQEMLDPEVAVDATEDEAEDRGSDQDEHHEARQPDGAVHRGTQHRGVEPAPGERQHKSTAGAHRTADQFQAIRIQLSHLDQAAMRHCIWAVAIIAVLTACARQPTDGGRYEAELLLEADDADPYAYSLGTTDSLSACAGLLEYEIQFAEEENRGVLLVDANSNRALPTRGDGVGVDEYVLVGARCLDRQSDRVDYFERLN